MRSPFFIWRLPLDSDGDSRIVTPKDFDELVDKHFGTVLCAHGFTTKGSGHSTFWRRAANDIYHFIVADPDQRLVTYQVKVFFSSPRIDRRFEKDFPDRLGIPTDNYCRLKVGFGIGHDGSRFPCKDRAVFLIGFERAVKPALTDLALPYLDRITAVDQMKPLIRHPYFTVE